MHYDLVIVGGGLVGAGLAVALQSTGLQIALIDARLPSNDDARLFGLNVASCQFLENIGVWSELIAHATPIHQVHVSHQGHFGTVRLSREDVALDALGYVVPARYIEAALNEKLKSLENCKLYQPAKLQDLQQRSGLTELRILTHDNEEKILTSRIVIGADGTESTVRSLLNIQADIFDYEQSALVTRTSLKRSHQHIAYERFTENGAIAMLPLVNDECATIWTADTHTIKKLLALSDHEFLQALQQQFGYRLGRFQQISQRYVYPLRKVSVKTAVIDNVYLLGNAAHTLTPIAAQGLNLALYEVAVLAEGIMAKQVKQQPFTALDLEALYAQTEKQQAMSTGVSHRLTQLFSADSKIPNFFTQFGMIGFNLAKPIKTKFIHSMIGLRGRVPRLLLDS